MESECAWCGKPIEVSIFNDDAAFCSLKCAHECNEAGYEPKGKSSCFVATAACKSSDHPIVVDLRKFRDEYLEKNQFGRKFVCFYYRHGPKVAKIMKNNVIRILTLNVVIKPIHFLVKCIEKI